MLISKGSHGETVKAVQGILNKLHYEGQEGAKDKQSLRPLNVDGIFGEDTEYAVLSFQSDFGLYADGEVGEITLKALESAYNSYTLEAVSPIALPGEGSLTIEKGSADAYGEGYGHVRLRSDAMNAYMQLYNIVKEQGAILTSSGGIRHLDAPVGPQRSATSFHYSGRALDLFIYSGMKNPKTDPYVIQRLGDRRYQIYARCLSERASNDALPIKSTIKDVVTYKDRVKGVSVSDHFIDLTSLFEKHGFRGIKSRPSFEIDSNSSPLGAEWWHFQWEVGLIPGVSTFGSELQKIYSLKTLQSSKPWKYKDYIFHKQWF